MAKGKNQSGVVIGYTAMAMLALAITCISFSVWAKPYTTPKDTTRAIVAVKPDTLKTLVVTNKVETALDDSKLIDTLAINVAFLNKMREKGELLSSDEFASRITDYYNTLVAVLTALFVLFTLVTYITFRSKFEGKFEDKARELDNKQREKIVDELRSMLSDSKKIDEVIQTAIGGRVDDNIAKKEEVDDLSTNVENNLRNIKVLTAKVDDITKKQQELFNVVFELQEQVASGAIIHRETEPEKETETEQGSKSDRIIETTSEQLPEQKTTE